MGRLREATGTLTLGYNFGFIITALTGGDSLTFPPREQDGHSYFDRADCGAAGDSMGCVAVYLTRHGLRLLPGSTRGKGRLTQGDVGRRGSPSPGVRMSGRLAGLLHSTISSLEHQHVVMLPESGWQDLQGVMDLLAQR